MSAEPRRGRLHRAAGRGRSTALTPDEVREVRLRHGAGEGVRALARVFGVSHETVRRHLAVAGAMSELTATA
jgi:hypothetical protein